MEHARMPKPGEIYQHFKGNLYQIITVATHTETGERLVVYQALYGDFKTYVRPLDMFISEVDKEKHPYVAQNMRFELWEREDESQHVRKELKIEQIEHGKNEATNQPTAYEKNKLKKEVLKHTKKDHPNRGKDLADISEIIDVTYTTIEDTREQVNPILLQFLDAESNNKKLEVVTANIKYLNDRLINDMAVSMDCTIEEGPLDQRIQDLIISLQTMIRFEDRRFR